MMFFVSILGVFTKAGCNYRFNIISEKLAVHQHNDNFLFQRNVILLVICQKKIFSTNDIW